MGTTYQDLRVWQDAMELSLNIHRVTKKFPVEEMSGMSRQLRQAAVSVVTDIAEGKTGASEKELFSHLCRARGSLFAIQTQLEIAESLGYIDGADQERLSAQGEDVARLLNGMIGKVKRIAKKAAA